MGGVARCLSATAGTRGRAEATFVRPMLRERRTEEVSTLTTGDASLLDDPVAQELLTSRVPARLAYRWTDGEPRVVPIWFHWTGEEMVFGSFANAPKAKAIADGDPLAATIDTVEFPHKVLIVRGPATVSVEEGVFDEYASAARRYFGDEQGEAWLAQLPEGAPMVRIGLRPQHVTILDFETRFPGALSS